MIKNSCIGDDIRDDSFLEDDNFPYFIIDKKGKMIDVNDSFCQKVGCTKEKVLGVMLKDFEILTKKSRKKMRWRQILKLFGTVNPNFILQVNTCDRTVLNLNINTKPQIKNGIIIGEIGTIKKSQELNKSENENINRRELRKTISELDNVSLNLDIKLQELSQFQSKIEKKCEEVEMMHEDLDTRNKIIEEIQNQLMQRQTLIVEKTGTVAQLEEGLNDLQNEIEIKNEELIVSKKDLDKRNKELIETKREIENNLEEIRSLNETVVVRDNIIKEIKEQLENKQTLLVENVNRNCRLQNNLDQMQNQLLTREKELGSIKLEIEDRCIELESLNANLEIRDKIIEQIKEQLTEKQMTLVEMTESVEKLQTELHYKKIELNKSTNINSQLDVTGEIGDLTKKSERKVTTRMELEEGEFIPHQEPDDSRINESSETNIKDDLEGKSKIEVIDAGFIKENEKEQTTLIEHLKLHEEIDKVLDRADDNLKTKKIEEV